MTGETARMFLHDRRDWLEVRTVPGRQGGWDIAIIIDGSYSQSDGDWGATHMAEYFTGRLAAVLAAELIAAHDRRALNYLNRRATQAGSCRPS